MGAFGKLKWQSQVLIVALVCVGLLGVVWYFVLSPISSEIETKTAQVNDLQARVDRALVLKATYEKFKKEALALEARLEELKRVLPQDKEIEQILSQVQASARDAGLRIQQGVSKPVVDKDVYSEWPIEMQVLGTYHNLGAFFERLRQLPRIVNIGKLRIDSRPTGVGAEGNPTSIGATYEAMTFVYRELAETAPVARP